MTYKVSIYIQLPKNTRREPFHYNSSFTSSWRSHSILIYPSSFSLSLQNFLSIQKKLKIAFTEIKRKTCTDTWQLQMNNRCGCLNPFSASNGGNPFKVCCRHRTAGLGFVKSGLLHRYPHRRGNISQGIGTPFHICAPSGPCDGRQRGLGRSSQNYQNSDFHPVVPMYHRSHDHEWCVEQGRLLPTSKRIGGPYIESFSPYENPQWYPGWGQHDQTWTTLGGGWVNFPTQVWTKLPEIKTVVKKNPGVWFEQLTCFSGEEEIKEKEERRTMQTTHKL